MTVQSNRSATCYMDVIIQSSRSTEVPLCYRLDCHNDSPVCQQMPLLLYGCHNTVQSVNKVPLLLQTGLYYDIHITEVALCYRLDCIIQ